MSSNVPALFSSLGWWEYAEYAACAVVFLGVLGETITPRFKDGKRKTDLERLSAAVLLLGLAGELVSLVNASKLTGQIIEALNEKAIVANQSASAAEKDAGQARIEAARLQKEAASLRKDAEDERLARLRLEKKVGPRSFNPEQESKLRAELEKLTVESIDVFGYWNGDEESKQFTRKLTDLLDKSGWHPHVFWLADVDNPISGVRIEFAWGPVQQTQPLVTATMTLFKALSAVGIHATGPVPQGFFQGEPTIGGYSPVTAGTKPGASTRIFVGKQW